MGIGKHDKRHSNKRCLNKPIYKTKTSTIKIIDTCIPIQRVGKPPTIQDNHMFHPNKKTTYSYTCMCDNHRNKPILNYSQECAHKRTERHKQHYRKKVRICQQQWNDIQHKNQELKKRMKEIETNIELYTRKKQKWIAMILKSQQEYESLESEIKKNDGC